VFSDVHGTLQVTGIFGVVIVADELLGLVRRTRERLLVVTRGEGGGRILVILEEVHLVVGHAEFFLEGPDHGRARVHFLPDTLLDDDLGLNEPATGGGFFLVVDEAGHDIASELVDELLLGDLLHFGDVELLVLLLAYALEIRKSEVVAEVLVGLVEPLASPHLFERVRVFVGIVLDDWLQLPKLRSLDVRLVPQKNVDLSLPVFVLKVVVEVPLQRSEQLEPALGGLLDLLLVRQTAAVLDGDEVAHFLVEL
jgi:hypothetical protein